jgi:hypothetical protein
MSTVHSSEQPTTTRGIPERAQTLGPGTFADGHRAVAVSSEVLVTATQGVRRIARR